jgi:translation initiation factor 3 subunit C
MDLINDLRAISKQHNLGPAMDVKILFNLIALIFDYNPRLNTCMKNESWNMCLKMLDEIIDILMKNDTIEASPSIPDDEENVAEKPFKIRGCVLTMNDRMCEEFVKILQQCDAHGSEYVERLKDEPKICNLIDRIQAYIERKGDNADKQELCRIYLKKVENVYYKYDKNNEKKSCELVDKLCKYIYTNDQTDRLRTKAMLCHIYHNALHDRWFEARDLMLMSHLQESIDSSDVPLQILYNRTMVQVGLCAFRVGNIKESHAALLDIQVGNRAKELLAQGMMVQRNVEKSKEQETKERQRLVPFHMHINLELLECIYLVSAMLIEIPYMSSRDFETKKRLISKQFHYQLKFSERQSVVGPPENMREHVVAASKAMRNGEWRSCVNFLVNDKMNAKVWDLLPQSTNVKSMLLEKVKEESLRTYLFRYSSVYESISVENLAEMFELPKGHVYSIISKMIINEELMASLDEPTQTVVMHRTEPTKLQTLALQLSEKITNLMDQTERMVQIKGGEMSAFLTRNNQGQQSQQNQQQNREHKQQNWKQQSKFYVGAEWTK